MAHTQPHERPAPRLQPVLHYLIARSAGLGFGEVKLNKAVVAADAEYYRRYGKTITGARTFQKQRFGPVPNGVLKALGSLRHADKITLNPVPTPTGIREEYVSLVEPTVTAFKAAEIDVMNIAIAGLSRLSADRASNETHGPLWEEAPMFGQIPIRAWAFEPGPVDQDTLAWAVAEE